MTLQYLDNIIDKYALSAAKEAENEFIESFENNYPSEPKISNDLANAKKQLEYYVKQKEYDIIIILIYI